MTGIFITGTDTDVGKTIISAGISGVLQKRQYDVGVFKPMLSGVQRDHPSSDTRMLKEYSGTQLTYEEITPYSFKEPLAPFVAAKLENRVVELSDIICHWENIKQKHKHFIVEGAGGIAVPMGEQYLVSHVIQALQLPIVIVVRPNLGTLNHTFLTVQYAKSLGLEILGIIINGKSETGDVAEKTNPELMEALCGVPLLGVTPKLKQVSKEAVISMVEANVKMSKLENYLEGKR